MAHGAVLLAFLAAAETAPGLRLPSAWEYSAPLIASERRAAQPSHAQKDPSVVFASGRWHAFMTIKCEGATPMEYSSFDRWENADRAPRTVLRDGVDETMTVDPTDLRFLFQGVLEREKAGRNYGQFPWRLGLLTPVW